MNHASEGINTVLRSLKFEPADAVLTFDVAYGKLVWGKLVWGKGRSRHHHRRK